MSGRAAARPDLRRPDLRRPDLRASDGDRQAVADRLGTALAEGRLDLLDYDDRLARAFAARTLGELAPLVADLPRGSRPPGAPRPGCGAGRVVLVVLWSVWSTVVAVNLTVWLLVSLGNGRPDYFWPMWLAVPGTVLTVVTLALRGFRNGAGQPRR